MALHRNRNLCLVCIIVLFGCKGDIETSGRTASVNGMETYRLTRQGLPIELVEGYVHFIPASFYAHENVHFIYELHIANNHREAFILDGVEVFDVENDTIALATFDENYLQEEFERKGIQRGSPVRLLEGNQFGIAHLRLSLDKGKPLPKRIFHRLNFRLEREDGTSRRFPMDVALIDFPRPTDLTLPLPFKKGMWFYGATSHKGSRMITEGKASYAQRFALDWTYVENDGRIRSGDLKQNESYSTHGIEVLAVADGIVVDVKDGIPENVPNTNDLAVAMTRETGSGNSVTIAIEKDVHAHYAHFIPNSLKVQVGDRVMKGQVIGLLGNSGNSSGPHLHFHLETASNHPLGGEGIPYHLESFDQYVIFEDEEWPKWDSLFFEEKIPLPRAPFATRINELPIANGFVKFE